MSYFWQIFQRLGLRVDFGFLTLTPAPILIPILSSPLAALLPDLLSVWRSVRVTAWRKATGYEFFITVSHCNGEQTQKPKEEWKRAKGKAEVEAEIEAQTEGITFM